MCLRNSIRITTLSLILVGLSFASLSIAEETAVVDETFVSLFDGQTLDGWIRRGGEATYRVDTDSEGGPQIVGVCTASTPNTFLCTERDYADFVLEFEVKVDPVLNSGVQFRSNVMTELAERELVGSGGETRKAVIAAGTIYGYQAEIDPTPRGWSGGIYDEARRGWIFNLEGEEHAAARAAFQPTEWNHYRIEAIGPAIKTFINGTPTADFTDDMTATGFIGLQVHAIYDPTHTGKEIRWRNLKISER